MTVRMSEYRLKQLFDAVESRVLPAEGFREMLREALLELLAFRNEQAADAAARAMQTNELRRHCAQGLGLPLDKVGDLEAAIVTLATERHAFRRQGQERAEEARVGADQVRALSLRLTRQRHALERLLPLVQKTDVRVESIVRAALEELHAPEPAGPVRFPVRLPPEPRLAGSHYPKSVPWHVVEMHASEAKDRFGHSIEELAGAGGLDVFELVALLTGAPSWQRELSVSAACDRLEAVLRDAPVTLPPLARARVIGDPAARAFAEGLVANAPPVQLLPDWLGIFGVAPLDRFGKAADGGAIQAVWELGDGAEFSVSVTNREVSWQFVSAGQKERRGAPIASIGAVAAVRPPGDGE